MQHMNDFFPITNPVVVFALVAVIILLAPIVMGRMRMPGMIGLLLAGAILGPNALGVLERDQSFVLFGTVGLLYIMFTAALEIDLAILKRYSVHSVVFGLVTFAIPQGLGMLVAYYVLGFAWPAAILLASMFASHTLLTYPIVSRLGLTRNQAVTTAVGGTIVTDTLALLVLAVIAGMTRSEVDENFAWQLGLSLTLYVAAILIGLPLLARWFFRRVARDGVAEFVFVLATVFGCAALSHVAGSEPIVGAFLGGLALNRLIPHNSTLMNRIQFTGDALFIPFFLLSVGMLLDLSVFAGGARAWLVAICMLATVLVAKWLAAETTRPLFGYSLDQARVVFGLSVPQAAATLAATIVGFEIGLFDDTVVNGAIVMILVTCFWAPIVVDRHGRNLVQAEAGLAAEAPVAKQRILVACSTESSARPLIDLAILMRDPAQAQPVYALNVVEDGDDAVRGVAAAERMLDALVPQLSAAGVPAQPVTRIDLNTAAGILRARRELHARKVIVGWRKRSIGTEFFFGSMVEQLLQDGQYLLIASRLREPLNTCKRIVIALPPHVENEDGFIDGMRTLGHLARQLGVGMLILCETAHEAGVQRRLKALRPAIEFKLQPIAAWSGVLRALSELARKDQLMVFVGVRPGGYAWRTSLGTLPERVSRLSPDLNMLVFYLPEMNEPDDLA